MPAVSDVPSARDRLAVLGRATADASADVPGGGQAVVADEPAEDPGGWVPDLGARRAGGRRGRGEPDGRGRAEHSVADEPGEAAAAEPDAGARWGARLVRHGPWGALAERWVPEPLRTARIGPGHRGAVIICLIALLAAGIAGFVIWRDRPQPRAVSGIVPQAASMVTTVGTAEGSAIGDQTALSAASALSAATAGSSAPSTSATAGEPSATTAASGSPGTAPGVIVVSVTGLVKHPGLVRLSADARVADAIKAAGGVVGAGDLTGMNLAARLTDGSSVVVGPVGSGSVTAPLIVPTIEATTGGGSGGSGGDGGVGGGSGGSAGSGDGAASGFPSALIDLNTADATALDALPGVGPVTAAAIVAYREQHGPFTSVDQLQAIAGIGPARFAQIEPHVTVGGGPP